MATSRVTIGKRADASARHQALSGLLVDRSCLALVPLALNTPALVALAAVALVCTALIAYEAVRFRETRTRVRQAA